MKERSFRIIDELHTIEHNGMDGNMMFTLVR